MVIKFQDKFESMLYAVLYHNLTGHFLSSKNEPENLFKEEIFVDIDRLNWQQICNQHNESFGFTRWLDNKNESYNMFKNNITYALRHWKPFKYRIIVEAIKEALKYGLEYVNNKTSEQGKELHNLARQVRSEVHRATGFVRFIPVKRGDQKFLLANFEEESQIGDLIIGNFTSRYPGYNLLLKTPRHIYFLYEKKLFKLNTGKFNIKIKDNNFEKFWEVFYQANFIASRKNVKLAQKLIPKKYWSWVKEGQMINMTDKGLI